MNAMSLIIKDSRVRDFIWVKDFFEGHVLHKGQQISLDLLVALGHLALDREGNPGTL